MKNNLVLYPNKSMNTLVEHSQQNTADKVQPTSCSPQYATNKVQQCNPQQIATKKVQPTIGSLIISYAAKIFTVYNDTL